MDGTLLNSKGNLSKTSYNILQTLIKKGLNFTVATGRTRDNAINSLTPLNLNLPLISDNGTFVYDTKKKKFLDKKFFQTEVSLQAIKLIRRHNIYPFINTLNKDHITVFYDKFANEAQSSYYSQRSSFGLSEYVRDATYSKFLQNSVFNFSMLDTYDHLIKLYREFEKTSNVTSLMFPGEYYEGYYWLEILPANSGKGQAVDFLIAEFNPKKVVCFGDNLNDLCMFERADIKIAPSNAVQEVKDAADIIIGHCDDDSVSKYILENF